MTFGTINRINYANLIPQSTQPADLLINRISSMFNRIISSISTTYYQVTMHPRSLVIETARDLATVNFFFTRGASISQEARGNAIVLAAQYGDLAIVEAVLANGPISEEDRGRAVVSAARNGHLDVIKVLLANGPISDEHRGGAIVSADRHNQLAMVQALLANGTISKEHRGTALRLSALTGDLAIVEALLENGLIDEKDRQYALFCAEKKFPAIIFALQGDSPNQALIKEIQKPYYSIDYTLINYILSQHVTSKDARTEAVRLALAQVTKTGSQGDLIAVKAVLSHGPILEEVRGQAVIVAAKNNNLAMVQAFLANGPISEDDRGRAVTWAAENNNLTMFQDLLINGPISQEYRGQAVIVAAKNNNLAMVQAFLANGPILEEHRGQALTWPALRGDLAMVQALLANGPISAVYRALAIENAVARGHLAILAALGVNPHVPLLDVHSGDRDEKTKNSIINFYTHQGPITTVEINEAYNNFVTYLQTPGATAKETASKQKAFHALVSEKIAGESFGPFIQPGSDFTINGHPVNTKEFIARLWSFVNHLADEKDKSVAISGIIAALEDSVLANNHRVCNGGKLQRLIVAVLQGRMPGINVESHEIGTEEISNEKAEQMFYLKEEIHAITKLSILLNEASKFCKDNPLVNKKKFLEHLAENRELLVAEQDVAASDIATFIDDLCK